MWLRLEAHRQEGRYEGLATKWLLRRWSPYFNAYWFVLSRREEHDADRLAAELADKSHRAHALAKMEVMGPYLRRRWWPALLAQAKVEPEPPASGFGSLVAALRVGPIKADEDRWLEQALRRKTGHADTHPSLSDRLAAPGVSASREPGALAPGWGGERGSPSAAEFYFGETLPELESHLASCGRGRFAPPGSSATRGAARARQRLAEVATAAAAQPLTPAHVWGQTRLELDVESAEAALPRLRAFLDRVPDHAPARYALGSVLLEADDPSGVDHIAWACERDPDARVSGYEMLSRFYERHGREREAEEYQRRAWAAADLWELARAERQGVGVRDRLLPHALTPEEVQGLRQQLEQIPALKAAYVVRKEVRLVAEKPYYVVAVELQLGGYWAHSAQARLRIGRALRASPLPGAVVRALRKVGHALRLGQAQAAHPGAAGPMPARPMSSWEPLCPRQ